MPNFVLSESDVKIIQRLVDQAKNVPINSQIATDTERSFDEAEDHQAPETYIALPPVNGIPGNSVAYSGSGLENTPGSAECDIYQIVYKAGEMILKPVVNLRRTVYNVGSVGIAQDWIPVSRDKYGRWLVIAAAGAVNESIDYEVVEAGCPQFGGGQSQWVYAEVLRVDCHNSVVEVGDIVQIFDPDEDLFNLPTDLLVGARGLAHYRRNDGFVNIVCAVVPEPYDACVWIGTTIKCREEYMPYQA